MPQHVYRHVPAVCAEAGCGAVAVYLRRCRQHQLLQPARSEKRVIARLRAEIIRRDGERCAVCGATERLEVHHHNGDPSNNRLSNAELRCRRHHPRGEAHQRLLAARRSQSQSPLTLSALRSFKMGDR